MQSITIAYKSIRRLTSGEPHYAGYYKHVDIYRSKICIGAYAQSRTRSTCCCDR